MLFKPLRQKGAMLITVTLLLITLVGFAALAFDIGHIMVVRNELQNGADASALAGANCLNKQTATSGVDCENVASPTVNWTIAGTKATSSIRLNKSDSTTLVDGTVTTGYWNVNGGTILQPTSLSPLGPCTVVAGVMTTACDKPAVRVQLTRASGVNGGPVGTLIASMFGGVAGPITATSVAVISSPSNVLPKSLLPIAINKCMFDKYWDSATNSPKLATTSTLSYTDDSNKVSSIPQTIGQPWVIRIGSAYHYDTCDSGQWTTFDSALNSQMAIEALIKNGNSTQLSIGSNTYISPGTKTANYNDVYIKYLKPGSTPPPSPANDVSVVVVNTSTSLDSSGFVPIYAFSGFHIRDVQGGSDKYIEGNFIKSTVIPGSSGIGPSFGTYTPPRLAL